MCPCVDTPSATTETRAPRARLEEYRGNVSLQWRNRLSNRDESPAQGGLQGSATGLSRFAISSGATQLRTDGGGSRLVWWKNADLLARMQSWAFLPTGNYLAWTKVEQDSPWEGVDVFTNRNVILLKPPSS